MPCPVHSSLVPELFWIVVEGIFWIRRHLWCCSSGLENCFALGSNHFFLFCGMMLHLDRFHKNLIFSPVADPKNFPPLRTVSPLIKKELIIGLISKRRSLKCYVGSLNVELDILSFISGIKTASIDWLEQLDQMRAVRTCMKNNLSKNSSTGLICWHFRRNSLIHRSFGGRMKMQCYLGSCLMLNAWFSIAY